MTTPTLYLHVGTPKTGTTVVQDYLAEHRKELTSAGIVYPNLGPFLGTRHTGHQLLDAAFTHRNATSDPRVGAFVSYVKAKGSQGSNVLISAEGIYERVIGMPVIIGNRFASDYEQRRRDYLQQIADSFAGFDIHVIVFVRRQDIYAESRYKQAIKIFRPNVRGRERRHLGSFQEFLNDLAPIFDYDRQLDMLQDVFGSVAVHSYHDGPILERFLKEINAPAPARNSSESRENVSTDARVVRWMQQMTFATEEARNEFGQSPVVQSALQEFGKASLWHDEAERDSFLLKFADGAFGREYFPPPAAIGLPSQPSEQETVANREACSAWSNTAAQSRPRVEE